MKIYEVWVPWPDTVMHERLIYLNELDGRLDFYYESQHEVYKVWSTNYYKVNTHGSGKLIFVLDGCTILKLREEDAKTFKAEVGMYQDNFIGEEDD